MDILNYLVTSTLISAPFIIMGLLFDMWLSKIGAVRSSAWAVIICTILAVFAKPFLFEDLSWWIYGTGILLGLTGAVHRNDLRETMKHGTWWWKKKEKRRSS